MSSAKNSEPRTLAQEEEEVYFACQTKAHSKRRLEQAAQSVALNFYKGSHRGRRRALGDRFKGLAWDKRPLPIANLMETLRATKRKENKDTPEERRHRHALKKKRMHTLGPFS